MQFFSYGGYGDRALKDLHYSQAARLPDGRIELSGQGGWDPATGKCKETIEEQVSQAFANIELALQTAGSSWSDVSLESLLYWNDLLNPMCDIGL